MRRLIASMFLSLVFMATAASAKTDSVLRLADSQKIDFATMVSEVSEARYLFLAENHSDARHHAAQLAIIKALQKSGRRLAIGLEMFTVDSQKKLDQFVAGKLGLAEFREEYKRNWNIPWEYYREILILARDNRIPLVGLNLPMDISRKVSREGFAALSPVERSRLPADITCNVSPVYMDFIRQAYTSHGLSNREFDHFCEAQLLLNRFMAQHLRTFAEKNPRRTLVSLVGIGHALKKGVPDETTRDSTAYRVILPEFPGLNRNNLTLQDSDYLLLFD